MNFLVTFVVAFVVGLVVGLPLALLNGWLLMLAMGIIHLHFLPAVAPVGYSTCVVLAWLLTAVFNNNATVTSSNK